MGNPEQLRKPDDFRKPAHPMLTAACTRRAFSA
jgi:hypothetical protein